MNTDEFRQVQSAKKNLISQVRSSQKYSEWRNQVLKRDQSLCSDCGSDFKRIKAIDDKSNDNKPLMADQFDAVHHSVHHIIPLLVILLQNDIKTAEQANTCQDIWDITNGKTLCSSCHKKYDDSVFYE